MNTNEEIPDFSIKTPEDQENGENIHDLERDRIVDEEIKFGPIRTPEEIAEAQKKLAELIAATKKSIEEDFDKKEGGPAQ